MKAHPLLFALVLAGCGGGSGGSSFLEANGGGVSLAFVPGSGYNGGSASLTTYDSLNGSASGNAIEATVTRSGRTVGVSLVANSLAAGTSVDLSSGANSSATYADSNGQWIASSGTVAVTSRGSTSIVLTFTNVVLSATGSGAAGTVTLSGTLTLTMS